MTSISNTKPTSKMLNQHEFHSNYPENVRFVTNAAMPAQLSASENEYIFTHTYVFEEGISGISRLSDQCDEKKFD